MKQASLTQKLSLNRKSLRHRKWSRLDLLRDQDRWWVDAHGDIHDVAKIDRDYRENLLRYFRRNARRLWGISLWQPRFVWMGSGSDDELFWHTPDPAEWIEDQPLVRRLRELA